MTSPILDYVLNLIIQFHFELFIKYNSEETIVRQKFVFACENVQNITKKYDII